VPAAARYSRVSWPRVSWGLLIAIGLTLFAGQFVSLFFAYPNGMPPGLASVTPQMQVLSRCPLAAACFRDIPTPRQSLGMAVAFCGLLVIVATIGGDLTLTALAFAIAAGLSWAIGNVLVRFAGHVATVALMAWASLVVPLPALTLSWMLDANSNLATTIVAAPWLAIGARSTSERCQPILLTRLGVGC
jgi:O-acetylserine/cysteine efflux transporter